MAPYHHPLQQQQEEHPKYLVDALYCSEGHWEEDDEAEEVALVVVQECRSTTRRRRRRNAYVPPLLLEQDMLWDDDELKSLLSKEQRNPCIEVVDGRREAVEWMMRVKGHYSFSALTLFLSVNYLDSFLSTNHNDNTKPWMTQLVAVACLSLAAKVEEPYVPLLLDLQVEESRYVFEAKTIMRMEILILSSLGWKMHPVTPLSFLDYITRRLAFKYHLGRCEALLLSLLPDSRFMSYLPSVLATAAINIVEPRLGIQYQHQLLPILDVIDKDAVEECRKLMSEVNSRCDEQCSKKRKFESVPGSPNGVMDVSFSSDSSNDSWAVSATCSDSWISNSNNEEQLLLNLPNSHHFITVPR